jgi:hypothetical protein
MTINETWRAKRVARVKAWREANQARIRDYRRQYYLAHRDASLSRENAKWKANPEARRVYETAWREPNKERLREKPNEA